ncbi:MAG: EAL domain-containing protein [Magnetospirillum sp.]|nr:EAL domain-containing protein [Magnetospirillum sp.]
MSTEYLSGRNGVYVAFAFAAADLLLEVDGMASVTFAVGASMSLLGRPARLMTGVNLATLIEPADYPRLFKAIGRMATGNRVRNVVLQVVRSDGKRVPVTMSGYRHPDRNDRLLVVLGHAACQCTPRHRNARSGLHDKEGFQAVATELAGRHEGEPLHMTLLDLPGMDDLRRKAGPEPADGFVASLGSRLRELSVDGDAAGQLSDSKYGVIHPVGIGAADFEGAIAEAARTVKVPPPEANVGTLVLDVADIAGPDAAHALAYTLNRFVTDGAAGRGEAFSTDNLQVRLSATVRDMGSVREAIAQGRFDLLFQPIVDLTDHSIHHFECLVRFVDSEDRSPYDTVVFAEDTGMVGELDLAVCWRAVQTARAAHPSLRFAVNLSGRSLSDPKTVGRLRQMLKGPAAGLPGRLLFELTESAAITNFAAVNAVLQEIRAQGFVVCLDDFGAGAAALQYLQELQVDHVKIDGRFVTGATASREKRAFLRAIAGLCHELGIATTAEYVEDAPTEALLKSLGVRYGQGWLFGKAMRPGTATQPGDILTPWLSSTSVWRDGQLYYGSD